MGFRIQEFKGKWNGNSPSPLIPLCFLRTCRIRVTLAKNLPCGVYLVGDLVRVIQSLDSVVTGLVAVEVSQPTCWQRLGLPLAVSSSS